MSKQAIDLWEAWIDLQCTDGISNGTLFVWGEIYTGESESEPYLVQRKVQGADPAHLYLEVVPYITSDEGNIAEVRYSESVYDLYKYKSIFVCAGEEVLAQIKEIEYIS
jgi:hypothetical protein